MSPFEFIYAPYYIDMPQEIYWRPYKSDYFLDDESFEKNKKSRESNPFRSSIRLKMIARIIDQELSESGEPFRISKEIVKGRILAFFPLHSPKECELLKEKWLNWNIFASTPSFDIKVKGFLIVYIPSFLMIIFTVPNLFRNT
jgi:hypothetical protein